MARNLEGEGFDLFETDACAHFWVRRTADGTAEELYNILSLIMRKYDPDFFAGEQEEGDYEGCSAEEEDFSSLRKLSIV